MNEKKSCDVTKNWYLDPWFIYQYHMSAHYLQQIVYCSGLFFFFLNLLWKFPWCQEKLKIFNTCLSSSSCFKQGGNQATICTNKALHIRKEAKDKTEPEVVPWTVFQRILWRASILKDHKDFVKNIINMTMKKFRHCE